MMKKTTSQQDEIEELIQRVINQQLQVFLCPTFKFIITERKNNLLELHDIGQR